MKNNETRKVIQWENDQFTDKNLNMIVEEPLSIRVNGEPYSVIMRTPGEEKAHVAGFCLAEGIIDTIDDFRTIASCEDGDTNVVTITLSENRQEKIPEILERKLYLSQTSCGICGKELIEDIKQILPTFKTPKKINLQKAYDCLSELPEFQKLRDKTRAAHGAAIYDFNYKCMAVSEDVGRHNAVDKTIGKVFLEDRLHDAFFIVLSSRISFELVQKTARAGIQCIIAYSRPTALALRFAENSNMTIICSSKKKGFYIFTGNNFE